MKASLFRLVNQNLKDSLVGKTISFLDGMEKVTIVCKDLKFVNDCHNSWYLSVTDEHNQQYIPDLVPEGNSYDVYFDIQEEAKK